MKSKTKLFLALQLFLMAYSIGGIISKTASGKEFLSPPFIFLYGIELLILVFYAIGWQQFVKRMSLSVAYANKAVTVIWGYIWGMLFFHEHLTAGKVVGVLLVLSGVILYGIADGKETKADE